MKKSTIALGLLGIFLLSGLAVYVKSCQSSETSTSANTETPLVAAPDFNADSAYHYVDAQVAFGPRVPNTTAHQACAKWLVAQFKKFGCDVTEQPFTATTYDGKQLKAVNIIGSINPTATKRIMLAAHWDARSVADKDDTDKNKPIDGANDGASGVGILLEIARAIHTAQTKPNVGIDFVLFDAEDTGEPEGYDAPSSDKVWWCLGSQYWAAHKHKDNYQAYYGILLDMVGAKGAVFPHEGMSMKYAPMIVRNVWDIANRLGYGSLFIDHDAGGLTDDHVFVNEVGKIQMIDIVELRPNDPKTFGSYHHTHDDNMQVIDKKTLKAVGQTVLTTLYQE